MGPVSQSFCHYIRKMKYTCKYIKLEQTRLHKLINVREKPEGQSRMDNLETQAILNTRGRM